MSLNSNAFTNEAIPHSGNAKIIPRIWRTVQQAVLWLPLFAEKKI